MNRETKKLIREMRNDPALQSTLDIDALLREHTTDIDPEDFNLGEIHAETLRQLSVLDLPPETIADYCERLERYRYIDEVHQLTIGRYIRWIRRTPSVYNGIVTPLNLARGAVITKVTFEDKGTVVSTFNYGNGHQTRFFFDNFLIFQHLADEELLVHQLLG